MKITAFLQFSLLVWVSCSSSSKQVKIAPAEHLQARHTSFHIIKNKAIAYFSLDNDVWYQDSVGITEIRGIRSIKNETKDTIFSEPLGYRFVDMRKKWAYEYRNLTDTAAIVKKFDKADILPMTGGWNFFRRAAIKFDSQQLIGDTTINSITYLKHRYVNIFQGQNFLSECFSRCDRSGTIFNMDTGLSNFTGCPVVKIISLTSDGKFPRVISDIEFISNKIPDSVQQAFIAWKRNVQKFPVE